MANPVHVKVEKIEEAAPSYGVLAKWKGPEFRYSAKTTTWYFWFFLVSAAIFAWAVYRRDLSFGLLIVLAFILVWVWSKREPGLIDFTITKEGVMIGTKLYRFQELESFWIYYEPPYIKELSIKSRKKMLHYIRMPLEKESPAEIRKMLIEYLPEVEQEQSFFESISKILGI